MNLEINFLGNMRLETVESDYQMRKISVFFKSRIDGNFQQRATQIT